MPVLDEEPAVWPENLFQLRADAEIAGNWFVWHVRPRTEKTVARRLRNRNIAYFLPQYERRQRYQRRLVCSHLPLFPSYIFVLENGQDRARNGELKAVVRCLSVHDQELMERELRDIDRLLRSGQPVTREERLLPGAYARIIQGPLTGLCGQVLKNKRGFKLVLQVHFLQQGVSVEVASDAIEAL